MEVLVCNSMFLLCAESSLREHAFTSSDYVCFSLISYSLFSLTLSPVVCESNSNFQDIPSLKMKLRSESNDFFICANQL